MPMAPFAVSPKKSSESACRADDPAAALATIPATHDPALTVEAIHRARRHGAPFAVPESTEAQAES
jgi:hypothetical protein